MLYKEYIKIAALSVHKVGNKSAIEGVELSESPVVLEEAVGELLKSYFLMAFKDEERYRFSHPISLELNAVYAYVGHIFDGEGFHESTRQLAKLLYDNSEHPNIKNGDFYVIHFKDCILDGETIDAVGLFKSENKDTYIKINPIAGGFSVESQTGMGINKIDKGCLIFNLKRDEGYVVCVVDNSSRIDAKYWVNDFLQLKRCEDDFCQTERAISLCKTFIAKLPEDYDKATKAVTMNKVMETLGEDDVTLSDIAERAFAPLGVTETFYSYVDEFQTKQEMTFKDSFKGKAEVIGRKKVSFVTKIKLDNNFEINVLGGEENLESGFDETRRMRFYTLFFEKER